MAATARHLTLAAVMATALLAFGCGDDDSAPETPAASTPAEATATPSEPATASPEPQPTAVTAADERVQEILAQPGLVAFLGDLRDAVEANDVQSVIDNTYFAEYECQSPSGFPPEECYEAPGLTLPALSYGIWQSEGGYMSEATYEAEIRDWLTGDDAAAAAMYAVGQMTLGDDQSPDVADAVVAGLGGLRGHEPSAGTAMSLAIAERDGRWMITEVDSANTDSVPHFYEWWIGWEEFASVAGLGPWATR